MQSSIFTDLQLNQPEIICYTLSNPPILADEETLNNYHNFIDRYTIISHIVAGDIATIVSTNKFLVPGIIAIEKPYDVFLRASVAEFEYILKRNICKELQSNFYEHFFEKKQEVWTLKANENIKIFWNKIFEKIVHSSEAFRPLLSNTVPTLSSLIRETTDNCSDFENICEDVWRTKCYDISLNNIDLAGCLYDTFFSDQLLQQSLQELSNIIWNNYCNNLNIYSDLSYIVKSGLTVMCWPKLLQPILKNFISFVTCALNLERRLLFLWTDDNSLADYLHFATRCKIHPEELYFDPSIPSVDINKILKNCF